MAIDSETKRRSVLASTLMSLVVLPVADGDMMDGDRAHVVGLYSGLIFPVSTSDLHIFSTVRVEPVNVSDSGDNVLVRGDVEVQGDGYVAGILTTESGRFKNTSRYTTTQTLDNTDHVVYCNTDSSAWTATLPAGVEGATYKIINSGSSNNNLTLDPDGSEHLIGENSSFTLYDSETLIITYNSTDGWY